MAQPYHHGALRAALIAAAAKILERDGIAALSLRAAAREAGVSHAAPAHHFGDLAGLLSALAAAGFVRLREFIEAQTKTAEADPGARLIARGRGYVGFARAYPGLFVLMFRSERLDWSSEALATAGEAAFALLTQDDARDEARTASQSVQSLVVAMTRWSLLHGLSTLLVDGRLGAMANKVSGADIETLIEGVLASGLRVDPSPPNRCTSPSGPNIAAEKPAGRSGCPTAFAHPVSSVMAGLDPAIHAVPPHRASEAIRNASSKRPQTSARRRVGGRVKPGHDGEKDD